MHNKKPPKHHISHWRHTKRFGYGLIPVRSPLLRESLLVSFPPLTDMLKFSGYSRLIRVQVSRQLLKFVFVSIFIISILCEIKAFKFPSIRYNKRDTADWAQLIKPRPKQPASHCIPHHNVGVHNYETRQVFAIWDCINICILEEGSMVINITTLCILKKIYIYIYCVSPLQNWSGSTFCCCCSHS
jgi:hypothetical protein